MTVKRLLDISFALAIVLAAGPVSALKNPASVYCTALGYSYLVEKTLQGDQGFCVLPGGQRVDAWQFLLGQVAQDHSYCATKGYRQKTVQDPKKCLKLLTDSCAVCVLPDKREVEVTDLMGLSLEETVCGDGACGFPENHKTCPGDCPSGSSDGYCDGKEDGRCDPDCSPKQDRDCHSRDDHNDRKK